MSEQKTNTAGQLSAHTDLFIVCGITIGAIVGALFGDFCLARQLEITQSGVTACIVIPSAIVANLGFLVGRYFSGDRSTYA
ncbi:MAG: hypothetical protein QM775_15205 [Pirellulales bacterium]